MDVPHEASWRGRSVANTARWTERLIIGLFAALIFLGAATLFGCFVLVFVYVWGTIL